MNAQNSVKEDAGAKPAHTPVQLADALKQREEQIHAERATCDKLQAHKLTLRRKSDGNKIADAIFYGPGSKQAAEGAAYAFLKEGPGRWAIDIQFVGGAS